MRFIIHHCTVAGLWLAHAEIFCCTNYHNLHGEPIELSASLNHKHFSLNYFRWSVDVHVHRLKATSTLSRALQFLEGTGTRSESERVERIRSRESSALIC